MIPIINMRTYLTGNKQSFIDEVHAACHEVGFFYLVNHPIPPSFLHKVLDLARLFFELPQLEKDSINIDAFGRGYGRLEAEMTYGIGDYKETYDLALERHPHPLREQKRSLRLIGPNQWPSALQNSLFKETILNYIEQMQHLGNVLMSVIANALQQTSYHFHPEREDAHAMLRLLHYPASTSKKLGVGEHVDSGFIALLLQDQVGGLQIKTRNGNWVDVPPIENHFIVNIGEMLQNWSGNYYRATLHRVINNANYNRISVPFFFEPNLLSEIQGLEYGEYLLRIFERSFPSIKGNGNSNPT